MLAITRVSDSGLSFFVNLQSLAVVL